MRPKIRKDVIVYVPRGEATDYLRKVEAYLQKNFPRNTSCGQWYQLIAEHCGPVKFPYVTMDTIRLTLKTTGRNQIKADALMSGISIPD